MQIASAIEGRSRWRISAVVMVASIVLARVVVGQPAEGPVAPQLEAWHADADRVRMLAENDTSSAYEEAKRLQSVLPAGAAPADRARSLNLLARIETYLALTEPAAAHAQEAFQLAAASRDRVGQAESDLNVALNAVNRGKLDEMVAAVQHSVTVLEGVDRPDLLGEAMLRTTSMYQRYDQFDD